MSCITRRMVRFKGKTTGPPIESLGIGEDGQTVWNGIFFLRLGWNLKEIISEVTE